MAKYRNRRWGPCPHCGATGWEVVGGIVNPRFDHDRPDGRRCRAAEEDGRRGATRGTHGNARRYGPPTEQQLIAHKLTRIRSRYAGKLEPWNDKFIDKARKALGLHGNTYPKDLAREATVDGIHVRLTPSKALKPGYRRTAAHRIQFLCPHCHKWQPAGRYGQHIVVHYPYAGRNRTRSR
jgi:hypothetical protein